MKIIIESDGISKSVATKDDNGNITININVTNGGEMVHGDLVKIVTEED